jgi:hypothetical protein
MTGTYIYGITKLQTAFKLERNWTALRVQPTKYGINNIRFIGTEFSPDLGCAIAQAVSCWLPTAAVRGSKPGLSCGILWWTKWRWGRFFRVLRFPLPNFIPPIAPKSSSSIIGVCTIGQSGRSIRDLDT